MSCNRKSVSKAKDWTIPIMGFPVQWLLRPTSFNAGNVLYAKPAGWTSWIFYEK